MGVFLLVEGFDTSWDKDWDKDRETRNGKGMEEVTYI